MCVPISNFSFLYIFTKKKTDSPVKYREKKYLLDAHCCSVTYKFNPDFVNIISEPYSKQLKITHTHTKKNNILKIFPAYDDENFQSHTNVTNT